MACYIVAVWRCHGLDGVVWLPRSGNIVPVWMDCYYALVDYTNSVSIWDYCRYAAMNVRTVVPDGVILRAKGLR